MSSNVVSPLETDVDETPGRLEQRVVRCNPQHFEAVPQPTALFATRTYFLQPEEVQYFILTTMGY